MIRLRSSARRLATAFKKPKLRVRLSFRTAATVAILAMAGGAAVWIARERSRRQGLGEDFLWAGPHAAQADRRFVPPPLSVALPVERFGRPVWRRS
jgi:hypothetical protein